MKLTKTQLHRLIKEEMGRLNEIDDTSVRPEVALALVQATGLPLAGVAYGLSRDMRGKMNAAFDLGEDSLKDWVAANKEDWSKVVS